MEPRINLTGLWTKRDKNGNEYFQGRLGNVTIWIFKNSRKEKDNQPDYNLSITSAPKEATAPRQSTPVAQKAVKTQVSVSPMFNLEETIDDLPF